MLTVANDVQRRFAERMLAMREALGALPEGLRATVVADPAGRRVGSGGSTLLCLAHLAREGAPRGTRTLVLDGLRFRSHPTHFSIDQAVDAASRIGATRTVLVHMTHDILHERDARNLPEGVEFGFDGLELR